MSSTGRGYYGNPRYDPPRSYDEKRGEFNVLSPSGLAAWLKHFKAQQAEQEKKNASTV